MIRAALLGDAQAIALVHTAAWAETYADLAPSEVLARWTVDDRTERWRSILSGDRPDRSGVAVLDLDGTIEGFVSWCGQRDDNLRARGLTGEVSAIYLLRAAQRQGHGRALMVHAARGLLAQGHRGAGLWVLRDNRPARAFYEGLGGMLVGEKADTLGDDLPVVEVAYAWPSLSAMTATASATMGVGSSQ